MNKNIAPNSGPSSARFRRMILTGCVITALLLGLLFVTHRAEPVPNTPSANSSSGSIDVKRDVRRLSHIPHRVGGAVAPAAEEIVANKVIQFGRKRRGLVNAIARRLNTTVPPEIEAFFDALESGNWEETNSRWEFLATHAHQYERSKHDRPDLDPYWQAVLDAYLPAQEAHNWPAQKFLDYGNAVLDSLRPGMVYVGGTDPGRAIPTLMNETSADPRIVLTQNALADGSYLDYLHELYGERFNTLSQEDSKRVYEEYTTDAKKRLEHDQNFPDEPKQVRPGEDIRIVDGNVQTRGQVSVMAVDEKLLQLLMQKNPDLSFAMEDSYPLPGMYADAVPLGPVIELHAQDAQKTFTAERAAESVDYWRNLTQQLVAEPATSDDSEVRKTYSKMIVTQASLFVDRHYDVEAEEAFRLAAETCPYSPEVVHGYVQLLTSQKRFGEAETVVQNALRTEPENKQFREILEQVKQQK